MMVTIECICTTTRRADAYSGSEARNTSEPTPCTAQTRRGRGRKAQPGLADEISPLLERACEYRAPRQSIGFVEQIAIHRVARESKLAEHAVLRRCSDPALDPQTDAFVSVAALAHHSASHIAVLAHPHLETQEGELDGCEVGCEQSRCQGGGTIACRCGRSRWIARASPLTYGCTEVAKECARLCAREQSS